jgi:hypothetical protein
VNKKVTKRRGRPPKQPVLPPKNQGNAKDELGSSDDSQDGEDSDGEDHDLETSQERWAHEDIEEQLRQDKLNEARHDAEDQDEIDRDTANPANQTSLSPTAPTKRKRSGGTSKSSQAVASPPTKKKRGGRKKGATSYTEGDYTAILDAVEEVLPTQLDDWKFVAEHYNKYAVRFHRRERAANGLRSKFRDLAWGVPSGGGERDEWETRAKEIERAINQKVGVVVIGDDDDASSPSRMSSKMSSGDGASKSTRGGRGTRLGFETMMAGQLVLQSEQAQERHQQKMELFERILEKL